MAVLKAKKVMKKKTGKRVHDQISKKLKNSKKLAKEEARLQKQFEKKGLRERGEVPKGNIALEKKEDTSFEKKTKKIKKTIVKKKKEQVGKGKGPVKKGERPAVICLTNIPHGFFEYQMEKYFSQFGEVVDVRLVRSQNTGRSCGFAFVAFKHKEVALIVANAMNNYLMFGKIIKCRYVGNSSKLNRSAFKVERYKERNCPRVLRRVVNIKELNAVRREANDVENIHNRAYSMTKKMELLKSLGVNVDIEVGEEVLQNVESRRSKLQDEKRKSEVQETSESEEKPLEETSESEEKAVEVEKKVGATSSDPVKQKEEVIFEADQSDEEIVIKTPPFAKKKFVKITPSSPAARIVDNKSQTSSVKKVLDHDLSAVTSTSDNAKESPEVIKTFKVLELTPGKEGTSAKEDAVSVVETEKLTKTDKMIKTPGTKKTPRKLPAGNDNTPVAPKKIKGTPLKTPKPEVAKSSEENVVASTKKGKSSKTPKTPKVLPINTIDTPVMKEPKTILEIKETPKTEVAKPSDENALASSKKGKNKKTPKTLKVLPADAPETPTMKKEIKRIAEIVETPKTEETKSSDENAPASSKKDKNKKTPKTPKASRKTPRELIDNIANKTPVAKNSKSLKVIAETPKEKVAKSLDGSSLGSAKKDKSKNTPKASKESMMTPRNSKTPKESKSENDSDLSQLLASGKKKASQKRKSLIGGVDTAAKLKKHKRLSM